MSREVFEIFKTGHANFSDPKSISQSLRGQGVLARVLYSSHSTESCHAYVVNQIKSQERIHNQVRFGQVQVQCRDLSLVGACFESHV